VAYKGSNGHVTLEGQGRDPNTHRAQYLKNGLREAWLQMTNRKWLMGNRMATAYCAFVSFTSCKYFIRV